MKGFGYAEFEDRESLIDALGLNDTVSCVFLRETSTLQGVLPDAIICLSLYKFNINNNRALKLFDFKLS